MQFEAETRANGTMMEMRRAVHLRPDHTTALWLLTGGTMVFDGDIMVLDNYLKYHGTLRYHFNEYRAIAIIGIRWQLLGRLLCNIFL